ncbi:glycoside hydrolase family 2 protein [Promicromonospora sp. NPDC060204]|uniref:glycoside hydrolase family 2 protein n=1 Tax=Promicromonospora sp. NPDC060204 TaxID=3347071 RepID=UPI0036539E34
MQLIRTPLVQGWSVSPAGRRVPADVLAAGPLAAEVPGSVTTDLLRRGLIDDPYLDDNESAQSWIGQSDWIYRYEFEWTPDGGHRQHLVFDGIDTVATVSVNGVLLGEVRNMHRSHRFDVTQVLVPGTNQVEVVIRGPVPAADAASLELGYRPHANQHPYNALRKMACSFGWDWGIEAASSGLWKPVTLESWSEARLASVTWSPSVVDGVPTLRVDVTVDRANDGDLVVDVEAAGVRADVTIPGGQDGAVVELAVPGAELWWPRGYGEPHLYDGEVRLFGGGEDLDTQARRIGFRTVEVRTEPDDDGTGFAIHVNGVLIPVRGANWIPDDAFPHRVTPERYRARITDAQFANLNLLRVWGGGIYESDDFYRHCDETGMLVWQDFLFACAAYAEEDPLRTEIEREAVDAVGRLGSHPSLVVLNGNNENLWGRQDWSWEGRLDGRTWGAHYYYELLPDIVQRLAPHVAYTPGSPFSPDPSTHQNAEQHGTMHIWDLWNTRDYPHYRDYRPRFVAEFGWQGPPTWSTLVEAIQDDPLTPESPGMLVHQKALNGNNKLTDGLVAHFPLPGTMRDWHWAMSLNQAVAVRTAVEWFRSLTPHCTGSIVWQLNDEWPVTSWAAVDGYGRHKPLLHALRQANADRLVTIQPDGEGLRLTVVDDTRAVGTSTVTFERITFGGERVASATAAVTLTTDGAASVVVPEAVATSADPAAEVLVASLDGQRAFWFFCDYRDSALRPVEPRVRAERTEDGWVVDVTVDELTRDLTLLVDQVDPDARIDQALVTLLPGETVRFNVHGASHADPADLGTYPVLRTANDLVARTAQ